MDIETKIDLITRLPIEEVITLEDLRKLLETKTKITAYDGFEPSGLLHLGSGILRAIKIEDLLKANVNFILWIADWFAWINNKFGGNLDLIKKAGKYTVEGWKACGVDTKKVKVLWSSDAAKDPEYWKGVINVAKLTTINRTIRASTIMGREEKEMQYTAQLFYPMMQAFDPFYFGADIMQLGMDAIFIHDTKDQIAEKIKNTFCPPKIIENNPILEIWKYIIFRKFNSRTIKRKFGGKIEVQSYQELEKAYRKDLHPDDLKNETIEAIDEILKPVRNYFEKNKEAKELYDFIKQSEITR